jgi:hypothetical protein
MSKAVKSALAKRFLSEGMRKGLSGSKLVGAAKTIAEKTQYHGIIAEMMEERVADVARMAIGDDGGMVQDINYRPSAASVVGHASPLGDLPGATHRFDKFVNGSYHGAQNVTVRDRRQGRALHTARRLNHVMNSS